MLISAILKFLSISRSLVSLFFFPFRISIIYLSISVILFYCRSLAHYVSIIDQFVIFIDLFI